jgi:tetratricopeptide (TPR) repeat protein
MPKKEKKDNIEETMPSAPLPPEDVTPDLAETQKVETVSAPVVPPAAKPKRTRWILGGVVALIVLIGLGALGGMQAGFGARQQEQQLQEAVEAVAQFQLGVADLEAGQCDLARQRFEYVVQLDPGYPGIQDMLVASLLCAGGTATPIAQSTEGPEPTPDLRGAEVIFADTQSLLQSQNWDTLLFTLDTLRKNFPDYNPIEVDRMYFIALRQRGQDRILNIGDLEGGIFDLNRAAQIGPLDAEAQTYRQWAIWYIVGQSFWEVDWPQVVEYFELLAPAAPNLHDVNFFTATDRLAQAVVFYAQELVLEADRAARDKQWCDADAFMGQSNAYSPLAPEVQPTAAWYTEKCSLDGNEAQN